MLGEGRTVNLETRMLGEGKAVGVEEHWISRHSGRQTDEVAINLLSH